MTVRRLLMIRELMSVKLRLILNYTRKSSACSSRQARTSQETRIPRQNVARLSQYYV